MNIASLILALQTFVLRHNHEYRNGHIRRRICGAHQPLLDNPVGARNMIHSLRRLTGEVLGAEDSCSHGTVEVYLGHRMSKSPILK